MLKNQTAAKVNGRKAAVLKSLLAVRRQIVGGSKRKHMRRSMKSAKRNSFFLSVLLDRGIPWELAWQAGKIIEMAFRSSTDPDGSEPRFVWKNLAKASPERLAAFFKYGRGGKALHRFQRAIAEKMPLVARKMLAEYGGDPGNIWRSIPMSLSLRRAYGLSQTSALLWRRWLHEFWSKTTA